jgi:hypothetical protein
MLEVAVSADGERRTLDASYRFYDDVCDCICELDVQYRLTDIPAGDWTLQAGADRASATVE